MRAARLASMRFTLFPAVLSLLLCLAGSALSHAAAPPPEPVASCECDQVSSPYTREPTADVLALFHAAEQADEARFAELIAKVPNIAEYAVAGRSLLATLLTPSRQYLDPDDSWHVWEELAAVRQQQIVAKHRASLPARTRMLALALQHGVSIKVVADCARHTPLQAVIVWGNPEMLNLLLTHGADVNQRGGGNWTALELALDYGTLGIGDYPPAFVSPEERTQMVIALLNAGAQGSFMASCYRPDYLLWPNVAALTRGEEVMQRLSALDTQAIGSGAELTWVMAARTGNLGGLQWLKQNAPRIGLRGVRNDAGEQQIESYDLWLEAASWALYPYTKYGEPGASPDAVLTQLLTQDMPWQQAIPMSPGEQDMRDDISTPQTGNTLLHHLVHAGNEAGVSKVIAMGAKVDEGGAAGKPPLAQAVLDRNVAMVRHLLRLGANPLGWKLAASQLYSWLKPRWELGEESDEVKRDDAARMEILTLLLANLNAEQRSQLALPFYEDIQDNLSIDATLLAVLLKAGLPLPPLDTLRLHAVWQSGGPDALQMLLDHGLKLHESQDAQSFLPTVFDQPGLLARLLEAGGDPNLQDAFYGMSPVAWAVLNGKVAAQDILLAKGGRLETAIPKGTASSLLELAVYSKNPAMLARLGWSQADLSPLCFDSDWGVAGLVLDSEETYWEQLL